MATTFPHLYIHCVRLPSTCSFQQNPVHSAESRHKTFSKLNPYQIRNLDSEFYIHHSDNQMSSKMTHRSVQFH